MVIILILLLAIGLRLVNLNQSLWLDEAVQAITAAGPFLGTFEELKGDFHPPLYHLLMWGWVHLFGSTEVVLRLPSVLFGLGTVWVIYLIAKSFRGVSFFPLLAALFLATAPFHIYYSQEARPYALATFLTSLSIYFFLKKKWITYIFVTALALYSSYFFLFVLLAQGFFVFLKKQFPLCRYVIISLLLFLPWLPGFWQQIQTGKEAMRYLPEWERIVSVDFWKALSLTFIKFSLGRITIFNKTLYGLVSLILFFSYGLLVVLGLREKRKFLILNSKFLILLWLVIPLLSAWLISFFIPNYQPFRLLLALPAFYLLLAFGVSRITIPTIYIILVAGILLVNFASAATYYFNPYFHREDWRGLTTYLGDRRNQSLVLLPSETSNWPWRYYSPQKGVLVSVAAGVEKVSPKNLNNLTIQQFDNKTIYYIRYLVPLFDPQEKIDAWLKEHGFVKIKEISFNQIPVWIYENRH